MNGSARLIVRFKRVIRGSLLESVVDKLVSVAGHVATSFNNRDKDQSINNTLAYRADIDGLRALSVSLVILYHANISLFPGGFIGVDVFFVISGYLISTIISRELIQQRFSFKHFYKRRIARILPLFFTVTFTSLLLAYVLFSPADLVNFTDSMRYAAGFLSNFYFLKSSGYFAPASELLPLLHTWSLAIEEQYYVFWPLIMIAGYKYLGQKSLIFIFSIGTIGLIAYAQWQAIHQPENAYYLLPARAFELLLGALLTFAQSHNTAKLKPHLRNQLLAGLGLILILGSALLLNRNSVFPGLNAFWSCFGAALIIQTGRNSITAVSRVLSWRPLAFIGLLSYSLYLWHWPVLVFGRYITSNLTGLHTLLAIAITGILSYLSWRFIEQPLRTTHNKSFRWVLIAYFLIPLITVIGINKLIKEQNGLPERLQPNVVEAAGIVASEFVPSVQPRNIHKTPDYATSRLLGDVNNPDAPLNSLIWGDSHVSNFLAFIQQAGQRYGFLTSVVSKQSCQPLLGTYRLRHGIVRNKCHESNARARMGIETAGIEYVFIAARWRLYAETSRNAGENALPTYIGDDISLEQSVENAHRVFKAGLFRTVEFIIKQGKTPVIFNQIPAYQYNPANCHIRGLQYPGINNGNCQVSRAEVKKRFDYQASVFSELNERYPQLILISYQSILCDNNQCNSKLDGVPLYRDNNHFNGIGSEQMAERYLAQNRLDWLRPDIESVDN